MPQALWLTGYHDQASRVLRMRCFSHHYIVSTHARCGSILAVCFIAVPAIVRIHELWARPPLLTPCPARCVKSRKLDNPVRPNLCACGSTRVRNLLQLTERHQTPSVHGSMLRLRCVYLPSDHDAHAVPGAVSLAAVYFVVGNLDAPL